jgi:glycosyltransferase involved in cell wall biosynthesis
MHILHISNSYGGTKVYENLYTQLDKLGVRQTVFVPLNAANHSRVGNQMIDFQTEGSKIIYSTVLKPRHRFLYMDKINTIVKDLKKTVDLSRIDAIHASTLCLDGAVAYKLHQETGIPYMCAIRNTDVNNYYKVFKWRKGFFSKILEAASKIIFISPKYKENFLSEIIPGSVRKKIEEMVMVIPNGVSDVFLANKSTEHKTFEGELNLIFVAAFYKGKGLVETIQAIDLLRNKGCKITLNAIGKGLPNRPHDSEYEAQVDALANGKDWIKTQTFKKPEEIIAKMRKGNAFIMVSKPETFGLVYVEALSQHLPIIYAQGQGFDGYFPDGFVGYPAEAGNAVSIAEKIESLMKNYSTIVANVESLNLDEDFDWSNIGKKYLNIYKTL